MKFNCSVEINLPVQRVVELFSDENNLKNWQRGFVSKEPISGAKGKTGSKSKVIFKNGKHTIELTETILDNRLPDEITGLYEHVHMVNTMRNCFIPLDSNRTKMETHIEYTKFNGPIPKLMGWLMRGMFRKQTQKMFDGFKMFAEKKIN